MCIDEEGSERTEKKKMRRTGMCRIRDAPGVPEKKTAIPPRSTTRLRKSEGDLRGGRDKQLRGGTSSCCCVCAALRRSRSCRFRWK